MSKLIVASTRRSAGKTSLIIGVAKALGQGLAYAKPFGDRLLYRKKRLWDYDAALITSVMGIEEDPEAMTIGFHHSKLRFMYDEESTRAKLGELATGNGNHPMAILETGADMAHGTSVYLDPVSIARYTNGKILVVVSGDGDVVVDDVIFVHRYLEMCGVSFAGVLINKIRSVEDFTATCLDAIVRAGIPVLGVVPYESELTHVSMDYLAEALFAKVVAGEEGLSNEIHNIVVGAMSVAAVFRNPVFHKPNKLVITSGDRSDMVLAALESGSAGIVLTNNILPPANITAKANELRIPLLQVPADTFSIAKQVDDMEPLITRNNAHKIALLEKLAREHVNLDAIESLLGK